MRNFERLYKLFSLLVEKGEIETEDFYNLGYNYNDIRRFIKKNILKNIRRGVYVFENECIKNNDEKSESQIAIIEGNSSLIDSEYRVNRIEDIISLTSIKNCTIENACAYFGYSYKKINVVRLLLSKRYYCQGDEFKGDEFIKLVERSPYKDNFIEKLINEVKTNKRKYLRSQKNDIETLSLKIKP